MCSRTGSTASATMACSPVRPARPISQRFATLLGAQAPQQDDPPATEVTRSHCENHAPIAAGRCASSRPSGVAKNRNPAHRPERPPHDGMHVIKQWPFPNCIAFWAGIGLGEGRLTASNALKLVLSHSGKDDQGHQSMRNKAKQSHLALSAAEPGCRFPHSARPDPTASS